MDYRVLISYSLGDAIDWKHYPMTLRAIALVISYSLGDAIDWKHLVLNTDLESSVNLLLARGRD